MEKVMNENEDLKKQIVQLMQFTSNSQEIEGSNLLKVMVECAKQNAGRKKQGIRYSDNFNILKEFGTLVYTLGGPMLYSIFSSNLPFPALSTAKRTLHSNETIIAGKWRFAELKAFLVKRQLPLVIWVSEDATRVNGRIQYDLKTNQIVGFVPELDVNGLPVVESFPATSAAAIKSYFDNGVVGANAYVLMAQALHHNAPPFCLAIWPTDNKFKATDVLVRWRWMKPEADSHGLTIAGISADGDGKLLSAMYNCTFRQVSHNWTWFHAELNPDFVTVQDTIHVMVKLRQKVIKPSEIIPMGNTNLASRGHLVTLISTVSKDQHKLTMTAINVKDKMNFKSAQDLSAKEVSDLLRKHVPVSEGTAVFLDMMRETTAAYLDPALSPLARVNYAWTWIFFARFWRQYILNNPGYSLSHNFISSNAYTCMEVNAHALIQIIIKLRDLELHDSFIPLLFSSQACEDFFRKCRSMSSIGSSVINVSMLELTHKLKRIDFLTEGFHNLKDDVLFPRRHKKIYAIANSENRQYFLPENWEIEREVDAAFHRAVKILRQVGILNKDTNTRPNCPLPSVEPCQIPNLDDDDDEGEEENPDATEHDYDDETQQDVEEDLLMISTGDLGVQTFNNVEVSSDSPFVQVSDGNGNPCLIKKTTLVWMYSNGDTSMSSDRLKRVQENTVRHKLTSAKSSEIPSVEEVVSLGDWCAFVSEDKTICYGRVLAFSYLSGHTWRGQQYNGVEAPVKPPPNTKARGVGCLCTWYKMTKNKKLQLTNMDVHGFYNIENYICTVPRPAIKNNNLFLSCTENDVKKFMKSRSKK